MVQEHVARLRLERAPQLVRVERLPRRRPRVLLVNHYRLAVDFQRDDLHITGLLELERIELLDHGVGDADAGRLQGWCVKMWNFSEAHARGAFAGKCVSAGGVELRAAARRRKE